MSNIIWSYSFLSTYERCPRQAYAKWVSKTMPYKESPEAAYGNLVHGEIDNCLRGKTTRLPDKLAEYQKYVDNIKSQDGLKYSEYEIGVRPDWGNTSFRARDVWGRGKIDIAIIDGDSAILLDWKTGKVREDRLELDIQAVLLNAAHPYITDIWGGYIWLKEHKMGKMYNLGVNLSDTKEWIETTMKKVDMEPWVAKKNPLCPWCENSNCHYYKETRREGV
jgi:PD-(D/E)XK nuclease superfamily